MMVEFDSEGVEFGRQGRILIGLNINLLLKELIFEFYLSQLVHKPVGESNMCIG